MTKKLAPIHPGEILSEDFMKPHGLSSNALSKLIGVPPNRVSTIVGGKRSISADTALRLEKAFGPSAKFWMNLQTHYELEVAKDAAPALDAIKPVAA